MSAIIQWKDEIVNQTKKNARGYINGVLHWKGRTITDQTTITMNFVEGSEMGARIGGEARGRREHPRVAGGCRVGGL